MVIRHLSDGSYAHRSHFDRYYDFGFLHKETNIYWLNTTTYAFMICSGLTPFSTITTYIKRRALVAKVADTLTCDTNTSCENFKIKKINRHKLY